MKWNAFAIRKMRWYVRQIDDWERLIRLRKRLMQGAESRAIEDGRAVVTAYDVTQTARTIEYNDREQIWIHR